MNVLLAAYSQVAAWRMPDAQVERLRREFPEHVFVRGDVGRRDARRTFPTPTSRSARG